MKTKKLLTVEEVAEYLQVNLETVRKWLRKGKLKGIKLETYWRIRESDLEKFITERENK